MIEPPHPLGTGFGARTAAADILDGSDLTGKRAIVTGGHSGRGQIHQRLHRQGRGWSPFRVTARCRGRRCHTRRAAVVITVRTRMMETTMEPRLKPYAVAPHLMQPMVALETSVVGSGLERSLIELVKTRASQINGCAYCLHLHTRDARAHGEREERLYLLDAWRESPLYSARERAALGWTEALTLVATTHAPDDAYDALGPHFTPQEAVALTLLVTTINAWNRIAVGFRMVHPVGEA